jgi:hypothetical protein
VDILDQHELAFFQACNSLENQRGKKASRIGLFPGGLLKERLRFDLGAGFERVL